MILETKKITKITKKIFFSIELVLLIFGMFFGVFGFNSTQIANAGLTCTNLVQNGSFAKDNSGTVEVPAYIGVVTGGNTLAYNEQTQTVSSSANQGWGSGTDPYGGIDIHFKNTATVGNGLSSVNNINGQLSAYPVIKLLGPSSDPNNFSNLPDSDKKDITNTVFNIEHAKYEYLGSDGKYTEVQPVNVSSNNTGSFGGSLASTIPTYPNGQVLNDSRHGFIYPSQQTYKNDIIISIPFKFSDFGIQQPSANQYYEIDTVFYATQFIPDSTGCMTQTFDPIQIGTAPGSTDANGATLKTVLTLSTAPVQNQGGVGGSTTSINSTQSDFSSDPLLNFLTKMIVEIIGLFIKFLVFVFSMLTSVIAAVLAIYPHTSEFSNVIFGTWISVRNLCNIFFMLALLLLGLSTLFRFKKYNDKQVLVQIVLMALMVNFSLVIARAILGVADTLQAQFLPANSHVIQRLGVAVIEGGYDNLVYNMTVKTVAGSVADVVNSLLYLFVALMAFMTFLAITALLVVRVVALWVLLAFSPVAYAGRVLGYTQKYTKQWWDNFLKYAFFTPILGFFLHLCALLADNQATYLNKAVGGSVGTVPATGDFGQFIFNILSGVTVIVCLFIGLKVANASSIAGSKTIMKFTTGKAQNWAKGAGKWTSEQTRERLNRARRNLSGKLIRYQSGEKEGQMRTGISGVAARVAHRAVNLDQYKASLKRDFENKNKAANELSAARIGMARTFGKTSTNFKQEPGIDTKADTRMLAAQRDEVVKTFMDLDPKEVQQRLKSWVGQKGKLSKEQMRWIDQLVRSQVQKGSFDKIVREILKNTDNPLGDKEPVTASAIARAFDNIADKDIEKIKLLQKAAAEAGKKENNLKYIGLDDAMVAVDDDGNLTQGAVEAIAKKRVDYINGLDPEKLAGIKIRGAVEKTADGKELFGGVSSAAKERTDDLTDSSIRNMPKETKAFFGIKTEDKKAKEKVKDGGQGPNVI